MNHIEEFSLKLARKLILSISKDKVTDFIQSPIIANSIIAEMLSSQSPILISRIGSVEMNVVLNYLSVKNGPDVRSYLSGKSYQWWWNEKGLRELKNNAGFFPVDIPNVEKFCIQFLHDAKEVDFLGSWLRHENTLCPQLSSQDKTALRFLEPFWVAEPWTKALEGRDVLVIHPFAEVIENQYKNYRDKLFDNKDMLPLFNLKTFRAVQSIGGECGHFQTWFDALEWMKEEIDKLNYEIALIGCGAYGLPLAAHIKRNGKKAFHLGGVLQLLFGIKGNRWENPMYGVREWGIPVGFYSSMMNDLWVRAGIENRPKNADDVEKACYW